MDFEACKRRLVELSQMLSQGEDSSTAAFGRAMVLVYQFLQTQLPWAQLPLSPPEMLERIGQSFPMMKGFQQECQRAIELEVAPIPRRRSAVCLLSFATSLKCVPLLAAGPGASIVRHRHADWDDHVVREAPFSDERR